MDKNKCIDDVINKWNNKDTQFPIELFLSNVVTFFKKNPRLQKGKIPVIHSIKERLKDPEHLRDKLKRKWDDKDPITVDNMFERITDFAGVRILHLYQAQFKSINDEILKQVKKGEWALVEEPVAYTWDPDSMRFFTDMGICCKVKDSEYTSIHYILSPKRGSCITCEVQVRTLFEEIWGEIDHSMNYPYKIDSIACQKQLRVLGKFISTGTILLESIFASLEEYKNK